MEISQPYRKLKHHLPMAIYNTLSKIFYIYQNILYQKLKLKILRCPLLSFCDQTEEAWKNLGLGEMPIG